MGQTSPPSASGLTSIYGLHEFLKLSARLRQWIHSSMAKDYSILFMRLCLVEIHPQFETLRNGLFNRQLRHDYSIIGGCCISDSDFDPCQGVIVSELSLQIFLGDTVTRCDRFTFPDYRNQSDYLFPI